MNYEQDVQTITQLRMKAREINNQMSAIMRPYQARNEKYTNEAGRPMYRTYAAVIAEIERGMKALGPVMVNYENENARDSDKFRIVNGRVYEYRRINQEYHDRYVEYLINKRDLIAAHIKDERLRARFVEFANFLTEHRRELNNNDGHFPESQEPVVTFPTPRTVYYDNGGSIVKSEDVRGIKCRGSSYGSDSNLLLLNGGQQPIYLHFTEAVVDQLAPEIEQLFSRREALRKERTKFVKEIHDKATELFGDWLVLVAMGARA